MSNPNIPDYLIISFYNECSEVLYPIWLLNGNEPCRPAKINEGRTYLNLASAKDKAILDIILQTKIFRLAGPDLSEGYVRRKYQYITHEYDMTNNILAINVSETDY